jgi:DNA-binding MarR family transcriptional regulator
MTINDLARDLLIKHNSAVGLVDRLVARGLLMRERIPEDRRKVQLRLSRGGEKVLRSLAAVHRQELQRIGPIIHGFLEELARPDKI